MAVTLTSDFAEASFGPIKLSNNTWGVDTWGFDHWVNGKDYRQTVTYTPGDLTQNVRFDWSYTNPSGNIIAYPEVILGYKPWDAAGDPFLVGKISSLRELVVTTDIDIRGHTDGFNIAYDLWLTNRPKGDHRTITTEVMVWLHPGGFDAAGASAERLVTKDFNALVYFEPEMAAGTDQSWKYVAVILEEGHLDGSIDLNLILRALANRGYVDRSDYLSSVELGAEVNTGTGGFTLNSFDWQHSTYRITQGADRLTGTATHDRIAAQKGNDTIWGKAGNDQLFGGDGKDSLYGGAGADKIYGGLGADRLTGGDGADRFVYQKAAVASGDRITDFSHSQGDKIDLRGFTEDLAFIGRKAFHFRIGEIRYVDTGTDLRVYGDMNGDGRADFAMTLVGVQSLQASDFLL